MESEPLATGMLSHAMHCLCEITDKEKAPEQRRRQPQRRTVAEAWGVATPDECDTATGTGSTPMKQLEQRAGATLGQADLPAPTAGSDDGHSDSVCVKPEMPTVPSSHEPVHTQPVTSDNATQIRPAVATATTQTTRMAEALPQTIEATTQTPVDPVGKAAPTSAPPAPVTATVATMTTKPIEELKACGTAVCTASHLQNDQNFQVGRRTSRAVVSPAPDVVHAPGAIPFSEEVRATAWISGVGWCMRMRSGALVVAFVDDQEDACEDSLISLDSVSASNSAKLHQTVAEPAAMASRTAGALLSIDRCGKRVALTLTQSLQQGGPDGGKGGAGAKTTEMALADAARDPAMRKWLQHVPCFMRLMRRQQ